MFIEKKQRIAIYRALFVEGVLVAHNSHHPKVMHCELKTIPNLHVIKTMKSLVSRNYANECYAWSYYYWKLTNEGIIYLRDYLHLPSELVPTTLINRPHAVPHVVSRPSNDGGFRNSRSTEDRGMYRRPERPEGSSYKRDEAGAGSKDMEFRGGFGHGRRSDDN